MALHSIPNHTTLTDEQFIQVAGPGGITTGYAYDAQQRALYFKESQIVFPSFHGATHIAEDPVPLATRDTMGLMSADDKCKLDALLQTRIGILGFQGAGFCALPGSRILMADGTNEDIEKIKEGDSVITRTGYPKSVSRTYTRDIDEEIFEINCRRHAIGGLKITGDHKVLAVKANDVRCVKPECAEMNHLPCRHNSRNCNGCQYDGIARATPQWIPAKDLEIGDFIVSKFSSKIVGNVDSINPSEYINCKERDGRLYSVTGATSVCGHIRAPFNRIGNCTEHTLPLKIDITGDFLKLCGYYLAEGYSSKKKLSFAIHRDDIGREIVRIMESLFQIKPSIRTKPDNAGIELVFHHALLAELMKALFGHGAHHKAIPRFMMELPPILQRQIVIGLYHGDGYTKNSHSTRSIGLGLVNRKLVEQAAGLLERCGGKPTINKIKISEKTQKFKRQASSDLTISYRNSVQADTVKWLWNGLGKETIEKSRNFQLDMVQGEYQFDQIGSIKKHQYTGPVYDLNVEDEHSFVINGLVVHNSDDGGWLQKDIILAAGSEFISIERVGNVIRFSCNSPIPFSCNDEECQQIYWIQDETDVSAIRPPSCSGKLPGVNTYGEIKIYLFPESTIVDPNSPASTLNNKGNYPSLIFKRYDDALSPGSAEYDLVLRRDSVNKTTTEIGWAFTPGAAGVAECVWAMGKDNVGNLIEFDLSIESEPGLLGSLLYKGHLLTKKMAVITGYTPTILSTNQYTAREWDVEGQKAVGDAFTAKNIWQYTNPENVQKSLLLDSAIDILPIGTLVELWFFKVGEVAGEPIRRSYFSKKPSINLTYLWSNVGQIQFGDIDIARLETTPGPGSEDKFSATQVVNVRSIERSMWGLTSYDTPQFVLEDGTSSNSLTRRARIDYALPGLVVTAPNSDNTNFSERPVILWNRTNINNALIRVDVGRPTESIYPPYDVLLRSPIDENVERFMCVTEIGTLSNGSKFIRVAGVGFADLPQIGSLRTVHSTSSNNSIFNYHGKYAFLNTVNLTNPPFTDQSTTIVLTSSTTFVGNVGDILELLHEEYTSPVVRIEFTNDSGTGAVGVQFKVGYLDISLPYDSELASDDIDDFVGGLASGYAVSGVYTQAASFNGVGTQPDSSPDGFVVYDGGFQAGGTLNEYWNGIEIMLRDNQVWIWWNKLLIPPNNSLSLGLPTPNNITTPYFQINNNIDRQYGKAGLRLWPGSSVRRMDIRTQLTSYSEFTRGQLDIV